MTETPLTLEQLASGLVGLVIPFITQLIKENHVKVSGPKALLLTAGLSLGITAVAYLQFDATPTWNELLGNLTLAFSVGQLVYNGLSPGRVSQIANGLAGTTPPEKDAPASE